MEKNKISGWGYLLLFITILLLIFGILIQISASAPFSKVKTGDEFYYVKRHLLFGILPGTLFGLFVFKKDLKFWKRNAPFLFLVNLILVFLVFFPGIGLKFKGAARWLNLKFFSFQPSEFLKLTAILYLASWLESKSKIKKFHFQTTLAFLIIVGIISLPLIFQPDFGTLFIIIFPLVCLYFLSNFPIWQFFLIFLILGIILGGAVFLTPYRVNRILAFLNPNLDPQGISYQIKQSLIAIGSGKLFGVGVGFSRHKSGLLPAAFSDSIFSILAEEIGFFGTLFLVFLYLIFFLTGLKIGIESKSLFGKLVSFGIALWISFQAIVHIGSLTAIIPLTGAPLPFISYGCSALISQLLGVSFLLNVSKKQSL